MSTITICCSDVFSVIPYDFASERLGIIKNKKIKPGEPIEMLSKTFSDAFQFVIDRLKGLKDFINSRILAEVKEMCTELSFKSLEEELKSFKPSLTEEMKKK